ncbi:MAG: phosphatidylglycerophosphatase A [Pseudomonadota bacterium]
MKKTDVPGSIWTNPIHFVAFGFGAGAMKAAPGTFGTLAAVPLYLLLQSLPLAGYIIVVGILFGLGVWLCHVTARDLGVHDHPGIVWDEIVGYLIAMITAPAGWLWLLTGFALFRLFDVWKPWPIHLIDRHVGGGVGIMFDDAVAGVYAWAVMYGASQVIL